MCPKKEKFRKLVRLVFWEKNFQDRNKHYTNFRDSAVPGMVNACGADALMKTKWGNIYWYVFISRANSNDANDLVEYLIEERPCDSQHYGGMMVGHRYTMLAFVTMQTLSVVFS